MALTEDIDTTQRGDTGARPVSVSRRLTSYTPISRPLSPHLSRPTKIKCRDGWERWDSGSEGVLVAGWGVVGIDALHRCTWEGVKYLALQWTAS